MGLNGNVLYKQEEVIVVFGVLEGSYCGCVLYVHKPSDINIMECVKLIYLYVTYLHSMNIYAMCSILHAFWTQYPIFAHLV